jgi:hypothetical protein
MRGRRAAGGHPLLQGTTTLLVIFLVLFPKGGLKLGGAPLTWGYMLVAVSAPPALVYRMLFLPLRMNVLAMAALVSLLPYQAIFLYSYYMNGWASLEYLISLFVNFFALPFLFLFVYPAFFPMLDRARFARLFCGCVFWAAAYGIFLFLWRPLTGHLIEIPMLTVNLADYGQIELTKHIARGAFLKLISTYNNGNVYGVATLILLPLYSLLEPRRWRRLTVRLALLLTLSRTVWAGLVVEQLLSLARPVLETAMTFPRVNLRRAAKPVLFVTGTTVAILVALFASSYSLSFLFDPTLGGRVGELATVTAATMLPSVPLNGFAEVLFVSALANYGYVGLGTLLLLFFFPLMLVLARPGIVADPVRNAATKGLILYVIVATSDGATNLIPVMAFYWFVYAVMLCGLPGRERMAVPVTVPEKGLSGLETTGWGEEPSPVR